MLEVACPGTKVAVMEKTLFRWRLEYCGADDENCKFSKEFKQIE
jgi:hypothetical protein